MGVDVSDGQRLEELEAAWRALYESSPDAMLTVDQHGAVIACNRTALTLFGDGDGDIVSQPLAKHFEPDAAGIARLARSGWLGVREHRFELSDGRTVSISAAAIEGSPEPRFHLVVRDVTTRRVLEEAEDQRRRMAALAEFAGALARELNDPMSIVQGRLELLLEIGDNDPAAIDRHLRVALDHARRISATLRNLRLVGQTPAPEVGRVCLTDAVEEALDLVGPRLRNTDLTIDVDPPDLAVGGDTATCARVLGNLINHAVDVASRSGRVEIVARREREQVLVQVSGGNFPAARIEQIASEYVDALGSLGLSVAHTLATALGARLEARRAAGAVLFSLALPLPHDRPVRARPVEDRLLVVGREELGRVFCALLDHDGYAIEHVISAEEALARVTRDDELSGVATDLFLQGMSGLSLADEILRLRPALRGRVLLVTEARLASVPSSVVAMRPPLNRISVLEALGRRVRRRR